VETGELQEIDAVTGPVIGAAIEVHRALGPGLLESAYLAWMIVELRSIGLRHEIQKRLPLFYRGLILDCAFRVDLL
jgi:GxxExxY protein